MKIFSKRFSLHVDENLWEDLLEEKTGYEEIRFEEAPVTETILSLCQMVQVEDNIVRNYSVELILADKVQKGEVSQDIAIKFCIKLCREKHIDLCSPNVTKEEPSNVIQT